MTSKKVFWLDFNDANDNDSISYNDSNNIKHLKDKLISSINETLFYLFPNGEIKNNKFYIGNIEGDYGKSLNIDLEGKSAGFWYDFATGNGGDIFDLWAQVHKLDAKKNFKQVINSISNWLHEPHHNYKIKDKKFKLISDYYPPTKRWDYRDCDGRLIACVYRYDLPNGKKEFRPWDVIRRLAKTPIPRPLYNQHIIKDSDTVILVEGEKSAEALTNLNIPATTAMNGSNAPVDKTDWSPLNNKNVIIWPDNDDTGIKYAKKVFDKLSLENNVSSVNIISIPENKPSGWDSYDAIIENIDINSFIKNNLSTIDYENIDNFPLFSIEHILNDKSPMPEDLIGNRILTPGGILVIGGAPKVGKSDFLLTLLIYLSAGESFLGFTPPRQLKIFCLQTEVQYHYLRERIQSMNLPSSVTCKSKDNFIITPQLKIVLNDDGISKITRSIKSKFKKEPPDIIVIDPIRNVFDGGTNNNGENDNDAMLFFLRDRIEKLRDNINPEAGIILTHHTKKIGKKQIAEDPFIALSGASSLRSYYTSGILLYKPNEELPEKKMIFELRNGETPKSKKINKVNGVWTEINQDDVRLIKNEYGELLDNERLRKKDVIINIIHNEANQGRVYTINQFAEAFEGKSGLGAHSTIINRIKILASKGYIKFFKNPQKYNLSSNYKSQFGYLCVQDMLLNITEETNNAGKIIRKATTIKPTHYKCPQTGVLLPVEDENTWIIHDKF